MLPITSIVAMANRVSAAVDRGKQRSEILVSPVEGSDRLGSISNGFAGTSGSASGASGFTGGKAGSVGEGGSAGVWAIADLDRGEPSRITPMIMSSVLESCIRIEISRKYIYVAE